MGALVALVLVLTLPAMATRDLWDPDEPRYMEVAREMMATGDYLVPHLNAEVYAEKPPLFFWLAAAVWRLGAGPNAGRTLSALAVCGTLVALWALCRREFGSRAALLAGLVAASTLLMMAFAQVGVIDALLTLLTTLAVAFGYRALHAERGAGRLWLAAYAAAGLGVLAKGPVGVLLPGLVLVAYGLADRPRVRGGGWAHAWGAGLMLAMVLAWLVPAVVRGGPDYARTILLRQNLGRAVQSFAHREPVYYYALYAPACLLPWSFVLAGAAWAGWCGRRAGGLGLLGLAWLVLPLLFLTCISGKRVNYMVPVVPAAGLLVAWYLGRPEAARAAPGLLATGAACVCLLALGGVAAALMLPQWLEWAYPGLGYGPAAAEWLSGWRRTAGALLLTAGAMAAGLLAAVAPSGTAGALRWRAALLAGATALVAVPAGCLLAPAMDPARSAREFGQAVAARTAGARVVCQFGNDFAGTLNLWTGRTRMPYIETRFALLNRLAQRDVYVVGKRRTLARVLGEEALRAHTVAEGAVGRRQLLLLKGGVVPPRPERSD